MISYSICLSLSDLFHLTECAQGKSMLSQMAGSPSFSWLNNIPLCVYILCVCVYLHKLYNPLLTKCWHSDLLENATVCFFLAIFAVFTQPCKLQIRILKYTWRVISLNLRCSTVLGAPGSQGFSDDATALLDWILFKYPTPNMNRECLVIICMSSLVSWRLKFPLSLIWCHLTLTCISNSWERSKLFPQTHQK